MYLKIFTLIVLVFTSSIVNASQQRLACEIDQVYENGFKKLLKEKTRIVSHEGSKKTTKIVLSYFGLFKTNSELEAKRLVGHFKKCYKVSYQVTKSIFFYEMELTLNNRL